MILTLPVGHLINSYNYHLVPGVKALEYKNTIPVLDNKLESIFHSDYGIVQEEFLSYFESIVDYLNKNKIKMFSFDIGPAAEKVEIEDYYYIAKSEILSKSGLFELIQCRIEQVRSKYSGNIAFENLNYFTTSAYLHVCEPSFIAETARRNNVYILLDIAHAIITAKNLEIDIYQYLSALPLDKVVEVHISSPRLIQGKWRDIHEMPGSEEFQVLEFILKNCHLNPYVVIEYYKNFSKIKDCYKSLMKYFDKQDDKEKSDCCWV
jgi:uncharacterized protein (UPF0276 family)